MYSPTKWMLRDFSDCNWDKRYELCSALEENVLSWRKFHRVEVLLKNKREKIIFNGKKALEKFIETKGEEALSFKSGINLS